MNYLLRDIPDDLWKKLKLLCVGEEISIREKIQELIEEEVERNEPKQRKRGRRNPRDPAQNKD
jgi:hypothetical protein